MMVCGFNRQKKVDKQLEDKLSGIALGFVLANETPKSDAISDTVALIKRLERDLKESKNEVELLEQKLIRKTVRGYYEHT